MRAIISVSDKTYLDKIVKFLFSKQYVLIASGNTSKYIENLGIPVTNISKYTGFVEILGGRVKTLHPAIYAGILARNNNKDDDKDLADFNFEKIDLVICNLYPFTQVTQNIDDISFEDAIENIDIGGVTLLRAAAKNAERVIVLCSCQDYDMFIQEYEKLNMISVETRKHLALKAFSHTAQYDDAISNYLRKQYSKDVSSCGEGEKNLSYQIDLRYGMNPNQKPAQIFNASGLLPIKILNGAPGYINMLDALNGWALVSELAQNLKSINKMSNGFNNDSHFSNEINGDLSHSTNGEDNECFCYAVAASFKHVSPAGVGISAPFVDTKRDYQVFMLDINNIQHMTPMAIAFTRARCADRMSSYGDFIALSHECDAQTAALIAKEVSDGIIAPSFAPEALDILKRKKNGSYLVIQIDPTYYPDKTILERKNIFGLTLEQPRNDIQIDSHFFSNIVSTNKHLTGEALRDLMMATTTLKYTQSNSVCYAYQGQTIGIGAGQQSRIHCTRLAGEKADNWWLRHHPKVLNLSFKPGVKRPEKINAIDTYITTDFEDEDYHNDLAYQQALHVFSQTPEPLTRQEKREWLKQLCGVCLSSDAFFPFRDSIVRAVKSGVKYIATPAGSHNDQLVIEAANDYGLTLVFTPQRLFHH